MGQKILKLSKCDAGVPVGGIAKDKTLKLDAVVMAGVNFTRKAYTDIRRLSKIYEAVANALISTFYLDFVPGSDRPPPRRPTIKVHIHQPCLIGHLGISCHYYCVGS